MSQRIHGIPEHWQEYFLCIVLHMSLPFLPIGIEYLMTSSVENKSLMLFSAMYALSIGISSLSRLLFGITVVASIFFSVAYGVVAGGGNPIPDAAFYAKISLISIFVVHALERYNIHVVDRTPFWDFDKSGGEE